MGDLTSPADPRQWAPAGNGYELSLDDDNELICRDDRGAVHEPIPRQALETRAYPAWALVHDPAGAKTALATVPVLHRASRATSGDAADIYGRLARGLPVEQLPVFWEHAARALLRAGDAKRAASAFGRAREAEETHSLPIEAASWCAAHLEFAAAGALSGKTAGRFAAGLRDRFEPKPALDALAELAEVRTRSGLPPWPELPRQITTLAEAAGNEPADERRRLIERLLPLPAFRHAPAELWKALRPELVSLAKASPRVRSMLLELFPSADGIDGWWLELLGECEALAALTGDDAYGVEPSDGAAGWLGRAVLHAQRPHRDRYARTVPREFAALVVSMSARLAADGVPVRLDGLSNGRREIDVRVLETCLAHGVPVAAPVPDASLDFSVWLSDRDADEDIPALAADPGFAPLVRRLVDRPGRDNLARVPALRPLLRTPSAGALMRHPLDDESLVNALYGLVGSVSANRTLSSIQVADAFLKGSLSQDQMEEAGATKWPQIRWESLIGRIGGVAFRAAAASTRPERRERLLALLEVWAETVFADPDAPLRVGVVEAERSVVRDESGAAVATGWVHQVGRRFVDLRTGEADPPALGTVLTVAGVPRGWGDAGRLRRLVSLVRERGPVPWDREAVDLLAERTGLSRAAAALVLAGIPGAGSYTLPFLDATERGILQIKAAEVDDARVELGKPTDEQRLDLLAGALPEDPERLWEPGGLRAVAEHVAEGWIERFGRRPRIPEETLAAARALGTPTMSGGDLCAALADPRGLPLLTADLDTWLERGRHMVDVAGVERRVPEFKELLTTLAKGVRWAYAELPAGDPVRDGACDTVDLLWERLAHPGLLLEAGLPGRERDRPEQLRALFGDEPYRSREPLGADVVDDGLTVALLGRNTSFDDRARLFFRPALFTEDSRSQTLMTTLWYGSREFTAVEWLLDDACRRMTARIRSGALPGGAYEANPRAVVPDLVAEVGERLGLEPDPAALYLQLLALLAPTDKNVRLWNGWTPARHKGAVAVLAGRGLVVEAKRARAGRGVFLPGGWAKADKPHLPVETWKAGPYGLTLSGDKVSGEFLPARPLPELFAAAWQRVLDGDGPR
ncbi:hypothetical protein [Streptosporangium lutulentum]|uniref:DNA-binding protein n=1 Tax=Streptosporangium lutulentum TaxID=1461250 RepID=A0ABT9QB02_9ACTN|nr:hypothetical protein [Streptosporangium lutulentum]MDP9843956.1 hypothetical protein [Streptosporangium lutulentum]